MWKCINCNTFNWENAELCDKCNGWRANLRDQALKANAPKELVEFIEVLEKAEANARQKLLQAKETDKTNELLSSQKEILEREISKLQVKVTPLRDSVAELQKDLTELAKERTLVLERIAKEEAGHSVALSDITKQTKEAENKLHRLEQSITKTLLTHIRGIATVIILTAVTTVIVYLVYFTLYSAKEIEVSISYNLGEIIAAVFAGSGIAAAGLAYAKSVLDKKHEDDKCKS